MLHRAGYSVLDFRGRQRGNRQCMNILVHHIKQGMIHQPMPCNAILAFKKRRNELQEVVPATGSRACMPGVGSRFVFQLTSFRRKSCNQARTNFIDHRI